MKMSDENIGKQKIVGEFDIECTSTGVGIANTGMFIENSFWFCAYTGILKQKLFLDLISWYKQPTNSKRKYI
jgi:hypothetical protein